MKKKNYGKKLLAWVLALAVGMTLVPVMGQREVQAAKIMNAWDGETTLVRRILLSLLIILQDMRIDKRMAESLVLRKIVAEHVQVDDHQADGQANLRRSQADAIAGIEGFIHIINQLLEFRVIWSNIFSHFSQNRLTININW